VIAKTTSTLSVLVPMIGLLFLLVFAVLYGLHKIRKTRKKLQKELYGIERLVDRAFELLKEDIEDSLHLLEHTKGKRKLTEEEAIIVKRLRKNIEDAEKVIHSEVEKAEKDL
jgi:CHASE3 domain sensor protein